MAYWHKYRSFYEPPSYVVVVCFLSAANQDFFRAAATRNPVINIAGENGSIIFCCNYSCCCRCCCLDTADLREVARRKSARDNPKS